MRRAHKLLSLLLVLTLALSICVPAGAAYSDTSGHWAESAIDRWSGYGIVSGDGNGFNPDGNLTRSQMAKVLAETLGLTKQGDNPFADVAADAWYTPYVLRCYEAGIMQGDGVNANPDATITREEAMVMLCRALGIAPAGEGALASFTDSGSVASWAAPYVAAMVQSGIVNGVGDNSVAPKGSISRASLMTILDRSVVQYINEPGSYELTDKAGIVLVAAGDVKLTGETRADVLVSPAAEGKAVAFDGATVTGSVTVQAEDAKVTSENSTLPSVSFTGEGGGKVDTVKPTEPTKPTPKPTTGGSSGGDGGSSSHTHSWGEGVVTTAATCTTAGVKTFTCTCGQTKTEAIPAAGHTPADTYTTDETGHWHVCTVCGEPADKTAHTYPANTSCTEAAVCSDCGYEKAAGGHVALDAGTVTAAATCTEAGVKTYTCSACNGTVTEAIPAAGHTEVVDAAVAATCTVAGKTEGKHCSVCDTVITAQETVDALGHDVDNTAYEKDESGHWHVCARCEEAVDKAAHSYPANSSCEAAAACTVCGYQKAAGTHVWGDAVETKAATCTAAGVKTYTCTLCGETKTEEIAKLAHTEVVDAAVAATCTVAGKTEGKHCSVCNTVITVQETVAATGHAYGDWTKVDDANHKRVCANDATHVETEAHTWNDGVVTTEPTETTEGVKTYTCTACGATKTESMTVETPGNPWVASANSGHSSITINFRNEALAELIGDSIGNLNDYVEKTTVTWGDKTLYDNMSGQYIYHYRNNDYFTFSVSFNTQNLGKRQEGMTLTLTPKEGSGLTEDIVLTNQDFVYTYSESDTPMDQTSFTTEYVEADKKIYFRGLDTNAYGFEMERLDNKYHLNTHDTLQWDYSTNNGYYIGGAYTKWEDYLGMRISLRRVDAAVRSNSVAITKTAGVAPWLSGQYLPGDRPEPVAGMTALSFTPDESSGLNRGIFTLTTTSAGDFTYGSHTFHISNSGTSSSFSGLKQEDGKTIGQAYTLTFVSDLMTKFCALRLGEPLYALYYFTETYPSTNVSAVTHLKCTATQGRTLEATDRNVSFEVDDEDGYYIITRQPGKESATMSWSSSSVRDGKYECNVPDGMPVADAAVWYWDGALTTDSDGNYRMNFIYYPIVEK